MKRIGLVAAGLVIGLSIGYFLPVKENFQLLEKEDGTIIKLNTETGEMFLLKGKTVYKIATDTLKTAEEILAAEKPAKKKKLKWKPKIRSRFDSSFAKDKSLSEWETLTFDKGGKKINARATLRSRLKDGKIQYVFRMRIRSRACWKKESHDLIIKLQNSAGTALKTINIHAGKKNIVWQPDKRTIDICVAGTIPCDEATYQQFASWYLQWTWYERAIKK